MTSPDEGWHGWAHENSALFVTPMPDGDHVGLYLQQGRDTQLAAVFVDPAMGAMVMDWLDQGLTATAAANTQLLERLRNEQPLAFARPQQPLPDDTDELFGDGDD